jgi:hypothetical protein
MNIAHDLNRHTAVFGVWSQDKRCCYFQIRIAWLVPTATFKFYVSFFNFKGIGIDLHLGWVG